MIRSDNEPAVKALVQAVALHREDETVTEEIPVKSLQSIGCNEHDHFLVGGMARALPIDMEKRFGDNFPVLHAVYSWLLNRSVSAGTVTQHSRGIRAESTMARCAIFLTASCSRFRLRRRQAG